MFRSCVAIFEWWLPKFQKKWVLTPLILLLGRNHSKKLMQGPCSRTTLWGTGLCLGEELETHEVTPDVRTSHDRQALPCSIVCTSLLASWPPTLTIQASCVQLSKEPNHSCHGRGSARKL
jgi:hypothetical protein